MYHYTHDPIILLRTALEFLLLGRETGSFSLNKVGTYENCLKKKSTSVFIYQPCYYFKYLEALQIPSTSEKKKKFKICHSPYWSENLRCVHVNCSHFLWTLCVLIIHSLTILKSRPSMLSYSSRVPFGTKPLRKQNKNPTVAAGKSCLLRL